MGPQRGLTSKAAPLSDNGRRPDPAPSGSGAVRIRRRPDPLVEFLPTVRSYPTRETRARHHPASRVDLLPTVRSYPTRGVDSPALAGQCLQPASA